MNETVLDDDYFKQKLLTLKTELQQIAETGNTAAETVELDQNRVGRLSRMDALQAQAMSAASNQRRDLELQRIEVALKKLEIGEYGWCMACGEEINKKRLAFNPTAALCIDCASAAEK